MNKKRITKDIVVFENFLTPEECSAIIGVIETQATNEKLQWTPISFYESYSSVLPKDNDPELEDFGLSATYFSDLEKRVSETVAAVHDKDPKDIHKIGFHAQKWEKGAFAREHSDNTDLDGNTGPFERSRYASFLYLNTDFEGGRLVFNKQNYELVPQVGLLASFAGGFENTHEVSLITKGTRYTLGSFWDDRDESAYPKETIDAWAEEIKKVREDQEVLKSSWKELHEKGYRLNPDGSEYKVEE